MVSKRDTAIKHIFSVDVEEYFQVEAFSRIIRKDEWERLPSRVEKSTDRLLEILGEYNVTGTFFVLGYIAQRFPRLVKKIFAAGHEIASHGYGHAMVTTLTPQTFQEDIRKSKQVIEDVIGIPVRGYRAPTFSIMENTSWTYAILLQEGFSYSSSVFPTLHDRYGWSSFGNAPKNMADSEEGEIWELPMSVGSFGPFRMPFGGGGYLRIYPLWLTKTLFRNIESSGRTGIVYVHPWELDKDQPVIKTSLLSRFRHHFGIEKMEKKLIGLLRLKNFGSAAQYLDSVKEQSRFS